MLFVLRKIRRKLIDNRKITSYLLYALGEVLLVVIGILIAVSLNNWNQDRQQQKQLNTYYGQISDELEDFLTWIKRYNENNQMLADMNRRSLKILASGHPDSLPKLKETLGALGTAWTINTTLPVLEEFIAKGLITNIANDSLKAAFTGCKITLGRLDRMDDYLDEQYHRRIEPFFNKNINYSEVAMGRYQKSLEVGGPATDYKKLQGNVEAWNIITFKLELLETSIGEIHFVETEIRELKDLLEKQTTQ